MSVESFWINSLHDVKRMELKVCDAVWDSHVPCDPWGFVPCGKEPRLRNWIVLSTDDQSATISASH